MRDQFGGCRLSRFQRVNAAILVITIESLMSNVFWLQRRQKVESADGVTVITGLIRPFLFSAFRLRQRVPVILDTFQQDCPKSARFFFSFHSGPGIALSLSTGGVERCRDSFISSLLSSPDFGSSGYLFLRLTGVEIAVV